MPVAERTTLREYSIQAPRSLKLDKEKGLIQGVKILGSTSRNGRIYTPQALSDAAGLYEGVKVYDGHDTRKYSDCVGKVHNASVVGDSVYGDLSLKKSHALYEVIMEDAEHTPDNLALSHEVLTVITNSPSFPRECRLTGFLRLTRLPLLWMAAHAHRCWRRTSQWLILKPLSS